MHSRPARIRIALSVAVLALLVVAGCAPAGPAWVDSGAFYTTHDVSAVYARADISKYRDVSPADTPRLRHDALTDLRKRNRAASAAADLITKTMPSGTLGVPVYVEHAQVDGHEAYVLVEAIGPSGGKLTTKRLWVLSPGGAVLFVGTRHSGESSSTAQP